MLVRALRLSETETLVSLRTFFNFMRAISETLTECGCDGFFFAISCVLFVVMQNVRSLHAYLQLRRCICSSNVNSNLSREVRFLKKMLQRGNRSSRKWYDMSTDFRKSLNVCNSNIRSPSTYTVRKMTARNKLFMEHITDQISMGEASDLINGSIEITHVEITPDFKHVNVFWYPTTDTSIDQKTLQKCAYIIRHELTQLRVIGIVPPIQFVENKQYTTAIEVEKKLAMIASDVKDFEILSYSEQMELPTSCADQPSPKITEAQPDRSITELPLMRQDVLGLDHCKIMSRIVASVSKSKAAVERRMLDTQSDTDASPRNVDKVADFLTSREQKELFKDFLNTRRIEKRRKYRMRQLSDQPSFDSSKEEMNLEDNDDQYDYEDEYYDDFEEKKW